jgi:hypothetical protein
MDNKVATILFTEELRRLRTFGYRDLVARIGECEHKEVIGADGRTYQSEIEVFWDSKKGGDVRVMVAADDGGWRAFKTLSDSFIMAPDGHFVGEAPGRL